MARAIALTEVAERTTTSYPAPLAGAVAGRHVRRLADAFGLTQFGVNLVRLAPGAESAHRHAHAAEDEFVMVLDGALTLVTDDGEQEVGPGMVVGFPSGTGDAHHLVNRSGADAVFLVVGTKASGPETVTYPDVDLKLVTAPDGTRRFLRKDGTPW